MDEIKAFHPGDNAWLLPATIMLRTSDSPDGTGEFGRFMMEQMTAGTIRLWSPTDFQEWAWVWQSFQEGAPHKRLPVGWVRQAGEQIKEEAIWFPEVLARAPWGRPGAWAEEWPTS